MQETRYNDGKVIREFIQESDPQSFGEILQQMHARAITNPDVKSVYQVKISRNDICPCGSGENFENCCINQIENR